MLIMRMMLNLHWGVCLCWSPAHHQELPISVLLKSSSTIIFTLKCSKMRELKSMINLVPDNFKLRDGGIVQVAHLKIKSNRQLQMVAHLKIFLTSENHLSHPCSVCTAPLLPPVVVKIKMMMMKLMRIMMMMILVMMTMI